jgi:hypothetical protein
MSAAEIARANYFERQYLGPSDLLADQDYHVRMMRTHWLGAHHWGVYHGLAVEKVAATGEWVVRAGLAVDAWGRAVVQSQDVKIKIDEVISALKAAPGETWVGVWIAYQTKAESPARGDCADAPQFTRKRQMARLRLYTALPPFDSFPPTTTPPGEPPPIAPTPADLDAARWPVFLAAIRYDAATNAIVDQRPIHPVLGGVVRRDVGRDVVGDAGKLLIRNALDPRSATPLANLSASLLGSLAISKALAVGDAATFAGTVTVSKGATDTDARLFVGDMAARHLEVSPTTILATNAGNPEELQLQPGAGAWSVNAGTAKQLKFENGRLGVGVGSPLAALHVNDAVEARVRVQSASKFVELRVDANSGVLQLMDANQIPRLTIDQGGNIGTGATHPAATLQLNAAPAMPASLRFVDGATSFIFEVGGGTLTLFDPANRPRFGFGAALHLAEATDLILQAGQGNVSDAGDVIFRNHAGQQKARIWSEPGNPTGLHLCGGPNNVADLHIAANGNVRVRKNFSVVGTVNANVKNFVIDHPLDPQGRQLVHACIEGPEAAVYYRGEARLHHGTAAVRLPDFFEALTRAEGRTIQLTAKFSGDEPISALAASAVEGGAFRVRAVDGLNPRQAFFWTVTAVRADLPPLRVERRKHPGGQARRPGTRLCEDRAELATWPT